MKTIHRTFCMIACLFMLAGTVNGQNSQKEYFRQDPDRYAGFYHSYEYDGTPDVQFPDGYTPFYISHYGRHGCRWHTSKEIYTRILDVLEEADSQKALTGTGKRFLKDMTCIAADAEGHYGDLTPKGAREHKEIAKRMYRSYPEVFTPGAKIDSRSTVVIRCILSMAAFNESLKEEEPDLEISRESSQKDMYYMSYTRGIGPDRKRLGFLSDSLRRAWIPTERFMNAIFRDGGSAVRKKIKNIPLFISDCYEIAGLMQDVDHLDLNLDYLFTDRELYSLWKAMNAKAYMYMGPSSEYGDIRLEDARPLLKNIVETADEVIEGKRDIAASLRFGHDNNIMALMALMEIEGTAARVPAVQAHEHWNITEVSPMAANLQFIFFRNTSGDIKVRLLINEKDARLPIPGSPFYDWKEMSGFLKKKYMDNNL